jgi:hydrogenase large subunit
MRVFFSFCAAKRKKHSHKSYEENNRMDIFIPMIKGGGSSNTSSQRVVIDPITRIEGHLRIEVKIDNGVVTDAWSSSTMFRGLEIILNGRDPRDAWAFTQRVCGVCTTVHSIASVRAVENALGIEVPINAQIVRNLLEAAQFVQDHVVHFYHLHATDWVDVVAALQADPAKTSALQKSVSTWANNTPAYFTAVKARLQKFVDSGQLGIFANGYWGHPAYKLPPEGNLLAVAHYLEALDWQREFMQFHALLGGKNPHPQTYLVGGMALPLDAASPAALTPAKIATLINLANQANAFVNQVYYPDLLLVASFYKDWAGHGAGTGNFLSFGDFPQDTTNSPASLWMPRGVVLNKNLGAAPAALDLSKISEYIAHSWYAYPEGDAAGKNPASGATTPNFTGPNPPFDLLNVEGKYSWLKAPRYNNQVMEVGPLARLVVAYAAGHARTRQLIGDVLAKLGVTSDALFSTLGRTAARGVETVMVAEQMVPWLTQLQNNITSGNTTSHNGVKWDPSTWPAAASGWGWTEAPRGALGHWVSVAAGKISSYQMVVPSTWNGSPRDASNQRGAWETALIGTPVADPARPVEILRTIHSFDPCMACAVHIIDARGGEITRVETY